MDNGESFGESSSFRRTPTPYPSEYKKWMTKLQESRRDDEYDDEDIANFMTERKATKVAQNQKPAKNPKTANHSVMIKNLMEVKEPVITKGSSTDNDSKRVKDLIMGNDGKNDLRVTKDFKVIKSKDLKPAKNQKTSNDFKGTGAKKVKDPKATGAKKVGIDPTTSNSKKSDSMKGSDPKISSSHTVLKDSKMATVTSVGRNQKIVGERKLVKPENITKIRKDVKVGRNSKAAKDFLMIEDPVLRKPITKDTNASKESMTGRNSKVVQESKMKTVKDGKTSKNIKTTRV